MSLELIIYLAGLVKHIHVSWHAGLTVAFFAIIPFAIGYSDTHCKEKEAMYAGKIKSIVRSAIIVSVICVFLPSERTIYMMLGASAAKEAAESETSKKVMRIIDMKLDDLIKEVGK